MLVTVPGNEHEQSPPGKVIMQWQQSLRRPLDTNAAHTTALTAIHKPVQCFTASHALVPCACLHYGKHQQPGEPKSLQQVRTPQGCHLPRGLLALPAACMARALAGIPVQTKGITVEAAQNFCKPEYRKHASMSSLWDDLVASDACVLGDLPKACR